jgi:hypothetical protein
VLPFEAPNLIEEGEEAPPQEEEFPRTPEAIPGSAAALLLAKRGGTHHLYAIYAI